MNSFDIVYICVNEEGAIRSAHSSMASAMEYAGIDLCIEAWEVH